MRTRAKSTTVAGPAAGRRPLMPAPRPTCRPRRRTGLTVCMTAVMLFAAGRVSGQLPFEVLHRFAGETAITGFGYGTLAHASDGNFYGTTGVGGVYNAGAIFKISPNGTFARLYSFTGGLDGTIPSALIQATDGNLYGTTAGGAFRVGTIFRMTLTSVVTTVYAFPEGPPPSRTVLCSKRQTATSTARHSWAALTVPARSFG
jgi:uncharacterized repeat protein (TIGR03803 family)